MSISDNFAKELRRKRQTLCLSRKALADLAYVSEKTIQQIEEEKTTPNLETACRLSDALQVSLSAMVGQIPVYRFNSDDIAIMSTFIATHAQTSDDME